MSENLPQITPPSTVVVSPDLGNAKAAADLGRHFGDTLFAAEIDYLIAQEWATSAEDILWRRTKCGLHMTASERDAVSHYLRDRPAALPKPMP